MVDGGDAEVTLGDTVAVCTYIRKRSPFFWFKYGRPDQPIYESSEVRIDDPDADFKLAKRINKIEAKLLLRHSGVGWDWVPMFFKAVYTNPDTLRIHTNAWNYLSAFLREREIITPSALTRAQVFEYLEWRTHRQKEKSKRFPRRNTALYEMRVLGRVMSEAVMREMTDRNPAANLKLKRDVPEPKPEILPDEQGTIFDALRKKPLWMQRSFRIALQTGLRFHETIIDLRRQIDWAQNRITIPDPKGGPLRAFTFEVMQLSILAYLRDASRANDWTWRKENDLMNGLIWRKFFDDLGMPEISFHCTRVTFITWCHRNRIPETVVMQLVNHASTEIHRIYQRLNAVDVRAYRDQVVDPHGPKLAAL